MYVLGMVIGSLVGGYVSSVIGRVKTMALFGLPIIMSNICVAIAETPLMIHISSFMEGLCGVVCMSTGG